MVVALLALFISVGGVGYAATKIGTKQIKNQAVTKKKLANGAVTRKKIVNGAVNAPKLGNAAVTAAKLAPPEGFREVGAPGQPGFQNGWHNYTAVAGYVTAGFYKDPWGIVHLKGMVDGGPNNVIFTLPPGYRPGKQLIVVVHRFSGPASLTVRPNGEISPLLGSANASLDGITFRAGQ